jgi:hypothetical protein
MKLGAGAAAQMVERLPSKYEALNSNPSTGKKTKEVKRMKLYPYLIPSAKISSKWTEDLNVKLTV